MRARFLRHPRPRARLQPRLRLGLRALALALACLLAGGDRTPAQAAPDLGAVARTTAGAAGQLVRALVVQAHGLDPRVLALALRAHDTAEQRGLLADPATLTVIDYSRPSIVPRFWVFDLAGQRLLFEEPVAHGRNSGGLWATRFSNGESSLETCLGLFVTGDVYFGKHGESLRLDGLEPGVNDRARERQIVIHGADYVSATAVATLGYLGRSWGCPALPRRDAPRVIERLKGGSAVFAYYPEQGWLASSSFLHDAQGAGAPEACDGPTAQ